MHVCHQHRRRNHGHATSDFDFAFDFCHISHPTDIPQAAREVVEKLSRLQATWWEEAHAHPDSGNYEHTFVKMVSTVDPEMTSEAIIAGAVSLHLHLS